MVFIPLELPRGQLQSFKGASLIGLLMLPSFDCDRTLVPARRLMVVILNCRGYDATFHICRG